MPYLAAVHLDNDGAVSPNKRLSYRASEGYVRGSWAHEMCSANGVGLPTVREHWLRTFFGGSTRDDKS
jgi:hypothetical protein